MNVSQIVHSDLYRLRTSDDFSVLGIPVRSPGDRHVSVDEPSVHLIEWPDRIVDGGMDVCGRIDVHLSHKHPLREDTSSAFEDDGTRFVRLEPDGAAVWDAITESLETPASKDLTGVSLLL